MSSPINRHKRLINDNFSNSRKIDDNNNRQSMLRTKLKSSMERKIEKIFNEAKKLGIKNNDFYFSMMEIITVIELRNRE